ncbi:hypothetical protein ACOSQ3_027438 [Xanthoceras sorbifolium]
MASSSSNTYQQTLAQQSQQSPTMDFGSLAKTLHFNLPIKLDEDNYIYWKTQIVPAFISIQIPDENGRVRIEQQPNKEYQRWKKSDQILLFWLISTLSQKVVGQVTKCKSSLEAWTKLENLYSQRSIEKILNLRHDFVLKIKNIGDALSAVGEKVSERDLLLSLMHGVGHEYDAVVVLISSQRMTMSLEEAQKLYYQLCTKPGHQAFQCFHRFDQQFVRPQPSHYNNNNSRNAAAPNQAYIGQSSQNSDHQNTVS